jgi:hypothetical protein
MVPIVGVLQPNCTAGASAQTYRPASGPAPMRSGPQKRWNMDFAHDTLDDGRPPQILIMVD